MEVDLPSHGDRDSKDSALPKQILNSEIDGGTMLRLQTFSGPSTCQRVLIAALVLASLPLVSLPAAAQKATPTNLTSDIPNVGTFNDTNLVNPWGLVASPS